MKTAFALVFLAVVFGAQATSIADIEKNTFGKNLLDTVYLEMTTGGNVDNILTLLQEVEDQIISEQNAHNERHASFQQSCAEDQAHYQDEINRASADASDAQGRLDVARPERDSVASQLETARRSLADTENNLAAATNLIEAQRAEFHEHESELVAALDIFAQAENYIRTSFQRGAFLQTNSASGLASTLKNAKLNAKYAPIARILAQAASSAHLTQDAVDNILSLIKRLSENAQQVLFTERQIMQQRNEAFDIYSAELEGLISGYKQQIAELSTQLSILEARIAEAESDLADAERRFESYTRKLAERIEECDAESRQYEEATKERNEEINIINQVEELISSKVSGFTEYITQSREGINID
jgi:chromosome segregation ATPase